ncbi:substrate-binding domain-containing protein [Robertmurraya korlensis]|uniref:PstS family phosphate ABC transporter substrate-binding protein n=1 Tax=Robertmurraya korlensis TaxID=519977 RepID=UPI00203C4C98|nr:substrate-binding domain-containing protein [Robertmurraya korlensis]MCM3600903.1 substrate-binding domain-containing protein [Robertmurraya korlensis]
MKLFGAIVVVIVFGFIGFYGTIILAISRSAEFYSIFTPIVVLGLIVISILGVYNQLKKKVVKRITLAFISLALCTVGGFEGYQYYVKSLEVVSTQDVDLSQYRPFVENSKVVTLNEASTFKIEENLPTLDGATALYPVYAGFVQAVYPDKNYSLDESEVVSTQTSFAFERLVKGEVDMVFMAHPSEEQMEFARLQGVELTLTPIGREAFVFFVHKDNPVEELSIKEIQEIYAGEITNWKVVGGEDEEIRAYQRPEGSGSQSALINFMGDTPIMDPPSKDIVTGMGGIIRESSNYQNRPNAIGYSFRHFAEEMVQNGKIKNIAVNGVVPTKDNIQNETYPIVANFYAITGNSQNPHLEGFIQWIQSGQGQEIVERSGYVPLK